MESQLKMEEVVENKDRRFGSADKYFPCMVTSPVGEEIPALFTEDQIQIAVDRAARNPEDIPEDKSFWSSLFG